jgi:membrane-associated phospholipid phosphatase
MSISSVVETIEEADIAVSAAAEPLTRHPVTKALGQVSEIADQPPMFTLGSLVLAGGVLSGSPRATEAGLRLLLSVAIATALKTGAKTLFARTRPYVLHNEGRYETELLGPVDKDHNSFPSGHTADAVAAARSLARTFPEARKPAYAGAAAIGLIQVPRGAHHPLDVAAGALVGLAAEALADAILERGARAAKPWVERIGEAPDPSARPEVMRSG